MQKMIEKEFTRLGQNVLTDFEEKRQKGENDSYVCSLIRNDSVEEFVTYLNQTNLSFSRFRHFSFKPVHSL